MILNDHVIKSASAGNKKGYFATFFIPPAEQDECVFQDIVKTKKTWRPDTSLSHRTSASFPMCDSHSPARDPSHPTKSGQEKIPVKDYVDVDDDPDGKRVGTARSLKAMSVLSGYTEYSRVPPPSRSAARNHSAPGRPLAHREKPIKYIFNKDKAFATPKDRMATTRTVINKSYRDDVATQRTCRPYSSYKVTHRRDSIAISPYGQPNLNGAAGRYREHYKSRKNMTMVPDGQNESKDYVFRKFFENLTLRATINCRSPVGVLKRPPLKPVRKVENDSESKVTHLHKLAQKRVATVHKDLGTTPKARSEGVEYVIAMEMCHNLETNRANHSCGFPRTPTTALNEATAVSLDAPRLKAQSDKYLTVGEVSIKTAMGANVYNAQRAKRGPIKCIERKPRVPSPPLSKLSRDCFLPEAIRRREMEKRFCGLRIAGATTPVADCIIENKGRSTTTTKKKTQKESLASQSELGSCENLSYFDDGRSDFEDYDENVEDDRPNIDLTNAVPESSHESNDNERCDNDLTNHAPKCSDASHDVDRDDNDLTSDIPESSDGFHDVDGRDPDSTNLLPGSSDGFHDVDGRDPDLTNLLPESFDASNRTETDDEQAETRNSQLECKELVKERDDKLSLQSETEEEMTPNKDGCVEA